MMTLKETIRERKASEPSREASSEAAEVPVRALQIHTWTGEKWILPWGYFYSARLQGSGNREQLVLSFANHEVVVDGTRLGLLLPEIAGFQLDCLRDLPEKFRVDADKSVPFISRVSVRPATDSDQTKGGAKTS